MPVEDYIRHQLQLEPQNRSFGATARGLRELYSLFGFIHADADLVAMTLLGRQAVAFAGHELNPEQIAFWRRIARDMRHDGGDEEESHPYLVLLRLVGRKPGISRAKCALALEAKNDSAAELDRIAGLSEFGEDDIRRRIRVTESNWDNAKKVLPSLAEQLGDVIVTMAGREKTYRLADAPGRAEAGLIPAPPPAPLAAPVARAPRTARRVTPETIARAGTIDQFDEDLGLPPPRDPQAAAETARQRLDRLRRHNLLVQALASRLGAAGAVLYVDPFDILALVNNLGILVEVKSLNGTPADERDRIQEALGQLLYYEPFAAGPLVGQGVIHKIACFERPISAAHRVWLNASGVGVIWSAGGNRFEGDALAARILGAYLEELR